MAVKLEAYQTIIYLPNPVLGDSEGSIASVNRKFSVNGTRYTYVKSKGVRRKFLMQFDLTRQKGLELREFIKSYYASEIIITDHNGVMWIGNFTNNPFDFDTHARDEYQKIQIEFEGIKQ